MPQRGPWAHHRPGPAQETAKATEDIARRAELSRTPAEVQPLVEPFRY